MADGRVDQGVFALWALHHHFGRPLAYIGHGGSGKQVRDLLHVADLVDLLERQLLDPEAGAASSATSAADASAAFRYARRPRSPRADRQRGRDRRDARDPPGRRPAVCVRICALLFEHTDRAAPRPREVLTDTVDWTMATAPSSPRPWRSEARAAVVTGSGGLIGSEAARRLVEAGLDVVGIENDLRATFFGPDASTASTTAELPNPPGFHHAEPRRSRRGRVERLFREHAKDYGMFMPPPSPRTTGRRAIPDRLSTPTAHSTCSRRPGPTHPTRRSSSARPTRSTATRRTGSRSRRADPARP